MLFATTSALQASSPSRIAKDGGAAWFSPAKLSPAKTDVAVSTATASTGKEETQLNSTSLAADVLFFDKAVRRASEATAAFDLADLPASILLPRAHKSKAREVFEHFDVDSSGSLGVDEVLLGLRAFGIDTSEDEARTLFDEADVNGSGFIDIAEFAQLVESLTHLRQGRAADGARLLQAASTLHKQALAEPLVLVAEGEVPTLLRCASSRHAAVELLGLAALAALAEAPQADCAAAVVARSQSLSAVFARLNAPDCPTAAVRQGTRLLSALCREAGEAREMETRRRIRLRVFELAAPLLHGPFADAAAACADLDVHTAQALAHALQAMAAEPSLVERLAVDGGGATLRLVVALANASDPHTRAAAVETIAAIAEADPTHAWRLVGLGAIAPLKLVAAAGEPHVMERAAAALKALHE